MPQRPLDYYCGTCRYALERETWNDGTPERFTHPAAVIQYIEPHDPNPVPMVELIELNMVCDFCSAPNPSWMLRFAAAVALAVALPGHVRTDDFGDWWAACGNCRLDVKAGRFEALAARYEARHPDTSARQALAGIGPIWRVLHTYGVAQEVPRG